MSVVQEIRCSNCGAPIKFNPAEIIATCRYCGFTQVIETGQAFVFEHSLIVNEYKLEQVDDLVRNWMRGGFIKPGDLARASKIVEKNLMYLPFWTIPITATSEYKGVFERLTPPVMKEGQIKKKYNWMILARKATEFPTREYEVPLEGKISYDFKKIDGFAKMLNSEIERNEATEIAKQQIEGTHRFLVQQDVDKIIEMKTNFEVGDAVYLHAPIWFIIYEYKRERYRILLDGATGTVIKGDIPSVKFGLI
jgi:hypothetical protein